MKIFSVCMFSVVLGMQCLIAAPAVNSVSSNNGPETGGNVVTIKGSGFTGASNVDFGTNSASFSVINDSTITATVPPGVAGTIDVVVTAMSQPSPKTRKDFYSYTAIGWKGVISASSPDEVALFDTSTNTFTSTIALSSFSQASAITPDGTRIYTADSSPTPQVTVIDVATNTIITTIPTSVGPGAFDIAINPSGTMAYVSNLYSGYLTVIDTTTNTVVTDISLAASVGTVSVAPDGLTVFVSDFTNGGIIPIDATTNTPGTFITTGAAPGMTSITPDGNKAYVANLDSDTVSVIDLATQTVINTINFPAGSGPYGSSILPNGTTMYVVNFNNDTVSVVDLSNDTITTTIAVSGFPFWAAATPDSATVYVINITNDLVTPIDTATNIAGTPFGGTGATLNDIVLSADPAPVARFTAHPQPFGTPTFFNASASVSPVGTIVSYAWDFGDGNTTVQTVPTIFHTYATPGVYTAKLTVTNSAGTSTTQVFSSRFMSNNGGPSASTQKKVKTLPLPPSNLTGFQKQCTSSTGTDIVNVLEWNPPTDGTAPVSYSIYRNSALTKLAATVSANMPLKFYDHNRLANTSYRYYIVSIDSFGGQSAYTSITVNPL